MNSKQIYQKYLETLWEVMQHYELVMFILPNHYYNKGFICPKSELENVIKEVAKYGENTHPTNILNTIDELLAFCQTEEKTTVKKSISNDIIYVRAGTQRHSQNSFTSTFNKEVILNLLDKVERDDDNQIFENLKNLLICHGDVSQTYWDIIQSVDKKYGRNKSIALFHAIPAKVDEFSKKENLKTDIIKNFNKIQNFFGKDHQLILNFVSKRAKQAIISQTGSIDLRDALIEFYQHESNQLEDYKEIVPSVGKYLEQTEDGDFFLQKSPRIISRIIDLEEFKAVTSIRISLNDYYAQLITMFLHTYKQKDKRILTFYSNKSWLNRKDNYISLFVSSNPKDPLPESEFDIKLKSFAKMLNKQNPALPSHIEPFMDTWWEAEELERELNQNGNKSKKLKL